MSSSGCGLPWPALSTISLAAIFKISHPLTDPLLFSSLYLHQKGFCVCYYHFSRVSEGKGNKYVSSVCHLSLEPYWLLNWLISGIPWWSSDEVLAHPLLRAEVQSLVGEVREVRSRRLHSVAKKIKIYIYKHTQANESFFFKNPFICHLVYLHLSLCLHPWLLRNFVKELSMLIIFTFSHSTLSYPLLADICCVSVLKQLWIRPSVASILLKRQVFFFLCFVLVFSLSLGGVKVN